MVDPFDLMALFRAGMAFMAALNLVFALMMFSRHCGTPVRNAFIMLVATGCMPTTTLVKHWLAVYIAAACVQWHDAFR